MPGENARLKLARLEYVGRGAAAAAQRRSSAVADAAARQRLDAVSLAGGARVGPCPRC